MWLSIKRGMRIVFSYAWLLISIRDRSNAIESLARMLKPSFLYSSFELFKSITPLPRSPGPTIIWPMKTLPFLTIQKLKFNKKMWTFTTVFYGLQFCISIESFLSIFKNLWFLSKIFGVAVWSHCWVKHVERNDNKNEQDD